MASTSSSPAECFNRNPDAPARIARVGNFGFAVHREDDELAVDASLLEPGQGLEAVHRRHVDVGDDHVRAQA